MTPVPLEIIETKILKPFKYPRLVHEGYLYHFHKKCNRHLRWKCNRVYSLKCPAVLRTNLDMLNPQCIAVDHEHVHGNDLIAVEQLKLKLRIHQTSTLFKKNTCFKSKDLDKFDEEINSPDNMLDNKLARFCASMNKVYFIDPLDPDHEYGNAKREEIIKINNSKDTSFNFENCPYTRLQQQNNQKQVIIENGITGNHTNYSSLKKCIKRRRGRPPKAKNMIVSEKKENDTQNNEITLLTNIRKETNILTTDTHKEINNLTAYTRKDKNSLISNVNKIKSSLRNKKNKNTYILTKNNRKGKKSLVSGIKNEKNMSTANSNTSKRSLTNTHTKNNIMTTQKQKNKSSFITNVNKKTISSKVKKYTSTFTNQNSNTIENSPIIISTSTITSTSTTLTSPIKIIPKIEVAPTDLTTTIISTPKIESKFSIESTPTVTSTPIIESLPSIKMAHTIERCMNKSINYEDDIIIISDNEDDDSSLNFFEVDDNEEVNNKINEIDLKDYDFMILTDLKKNWPTIESTPIIESTPKIENTSTITSSTIESIPTIESTPKIENTSIITSTPTIISTPIIESTPTITSSTIESIPTIESTPKIENTSTITSISTIISTSTIECIPTIENTPKIESTPTITSTPTIISTSTIESIPTIESTPKIESTPTITSTPSIINTPTIASLPSIKMAETIERCMNKSIDYDDDIIVISDNEDDGSNLNFFEVNDNEKIDDEINEIDLKDYESMILTDLKKNWPTILNKMSDPFTGIKVFESILFNKLLFRIIQGNIKTKKKLDQYKTSIDHWESKFVCLSQQMKTLVNNIKNDKNTRLINIQDKNVQDTTLCSNIGVDKQTNNIDIKKKVSTELKSDITPDNLKTSKLCQQSLKNKNKYLSESDYDIMTSKSEEIKTNISSTPVKADLIKDIPTDLTITEQNYLIQSDSGIKINQSKDNESNELFTPVSDVTKALELSPKSLKRKISNLIQNNTSIEIIKPKFVKCSEPSSLAFIDSTIGSLPDMMNSRLSPKLLNSQIKNFTHHSTAIEMTESNKTEYYEPSTSASIDATVNNLPAITNSRLSVEKNIFTQYSNDTEIIPSISISTDLSSNIPTFSSSSMRAITPLNDKAITPPLCIDASSNVEILKNSKISTMKLKRKNSEEWTSPRKITVYPKTGSSIGRSIFLPFAIKQILKSNKHSPSQPIIVNKLLKYSYKAIQLDKRDILNTPIIPVQMKTPLPDVVYESTQIMNEINCKETIQSKYLHDQHKSPNQVKSVPKAIPLLPSEIIDDFSNKK